MSYEQILKSLNCNRVIKDYNCDLRLLQIVRDIEKHFLQLFTESTMNMANIFAKNNINTPSASPTNYFKFFGFF